MQDIDLLSNWFGDKGEKFAKSVEKYCIGLTSPRQHVLVTQTYLDYFRHKKAQLNGYDVPKPKSILRASFKDPVFRNWKSTLWGKVAEKPIDLNQIIERIDGAK